MNRRNFLSCLPVVASVPSIADERKRYGRIDPSTCAALRGQGVYLRTRFNGEDVGYRCREANDIEGYVILMKHIEGKPYLIGNELAIEKLYGDVVIEPISEAEWMDRKR